MHHGSATGDRRLSRRGAPAPRRRHAHLGIEEIARQSSSIDLDCTVNPDGPWARTSREIRTEFRTAADRFRATQVLSGTERAALSHREEYTAGVLAAARWTLAVSPRRPMDGRHAPVDDAEVVGQLTHARRVVDCDGAGVDLAHGVLDWLQWITGGLDRIVPPEG
jgi:hypothetical protein